MKAVKWLIAVVLLFSLSAAGSWYVQEKLTNKPAAGEADEPKRVAGSKAGALTATRTAPNQEKAMSPVRPTAPADPEAVARLAESVQKQAETIRAREQQVASRQKNLELILQDIRGEQKKVDDLRKLVDDEMKALKDRADTVEQRAADARLEKQKLVEQVKEVKQAVLEVDDAERRRVKQMAAMYDSMQPETAAQTLQQMVEGGKLDMAVKILANMRERQAARVLGQLPDQTVAVQMLDRLRGLKPAAKE